MFCLWLNCLIDSLLLVLITKLEKEEGKTPKFWMPLVYIVPSLLKATAHATNYYILGLGFKSSDLLG